MKRYFFNSLDTQFDTNTSFYLVIKCLFCVHYRKKNSPTQIDNALCDINECNFVRSRPFSIVGGNSSNIMATIGIKDNHKCLSFEENQFVTQVNDDLEG